MIGYILPMRLVFISFFFLVLFSCQSDLDVDRDGVVDDIDHEHNTREGVPVDENGVMQNPIYLDENGITIKAKDWAFVGDSGMLNGEEYLIVSRQQLRYKIVNGEDVTHVCTSRLVYLSGMIREMPSFNQNISHWDTANVIDMESMFSGATSFNQDLRHWDVKKVVRCNSFSADTPEWVLPKPSFSNCSP